VDVSTDGHRGVHSLYVALLGQYFSGFGAEVFDLLLADDFAFA